MQAWPRARQDEPHLRFGKVHLRLGEVEPIYYGIVTLKTVQLSSISLFYIKNIYELHFNSLTH